MEGSGQLHTPAVLLLQRADTLWIEGSGFHTTALEDVQGRKILLLPGLENGPLSRPALSHSIYWLRYPDSYNDGVLCFEELRILH
jgi:hypothetical protein